MYYYRHLANLCGHACSAIAEAANQCCRTPTADDRADNYTGAEETAATNQHAAEEAKATSQDNLLLVQPEGIRADAEADGMGTVPAVADESGDAAGASGCLTVAGTEAPHFDNGGYPSSTASYLLATSNNPETGGGSDTEVDDASPPAGNGGYPSSTASYLLATSNNPEAVVAGCDQAQTSGSNVGGACLTRPECGASESGGATACPSHENERIVPSNQKSGDQQRNRSAIEPSKKLPSTVVNHQYVNVQDAAAQVKAIAAADNSQGNPETAQTGGGGGGGGGQGIRRKPDAQKGSIYDEFGANSSRVGGSDVTDPGGYLTVVGSEATHAVAVAPRHGYVNVQDAAAQAKAVVVGIVQDSGKPTGKKCIQNTSVGPCTTTVTVGNALRCVDHTCQHPDCLKGKSSKVQYCTAHRGASDVAANQPHAAATALGHSNQQPAAKHGYVNVPDAAAQVKAVAADISHGNRKAAQTGGGVGGQGIQRDSDARKGSVYDGFGASSGGGDDDGSRDGGGGGTIERHSDARKKGSVYLGFADTEDV
jgi:hypothetical protein